MLTKKIKLNKDAMQNGVDFIPIELIRKALLVRLCEEKLLELFTAGRLNGTIHTCIGQEWCGVATLAHASDDDYVLSNHRGHGHYLARTDDVEGLIAEVMGRISGVCRGVGGSQHLHRDRFFSNGVQGGMTPVAAGLGLAIEREGSNAIVMVFIGDGTLGEGVLYEAMNLCAIWNLPVLFVVEHNGIAQSTETANTIAGTVRGRAEAFGLMYNEADTWDVPVLIRISEKMIDAVRTLRRPGLLCVKTFRLRAHSKGDDTRDAEWVRQHEDMDLITQLMRQPDAEIGAMLASIERRINNAVATALDSPAGGVAELAPINIRSSVTWSEAAEDPKRFNVLVHRQIEEMLAEDPACCLIGEDLLHPYGGAFKVSRDLSLRFPQQVRSAPISEAAIVGMAIGLALAGHRSIAEIMFGDFMTLTLDQLLQHASKFVSMYGRRVPLPLVVRTPMGGRRGYGPTHSQSIEKHFLGIPDLRVVALNRRCPPRAVYAAVRSSAEPVLIIENKVLYTRHWESGSPVGFSMELSSDAFPVVRMRPGAARHDVTIVCYGGMMESVEAAALAAFDEHEVICEVLCPSLLHPLDIEPIAESVRRSGRIVLVEEGPTFAAWGSEVLAQLVVTGVRIDAAVRLGHDGIIPSCFERECELLPDTNAIIEAIRKVAP